MTKSFETAMRQVLMGSVAVAALAVPVSAQEGDGDAVAEVITVTGERARNIATIAQKRSRYAVYDSINIDDIGQLPDFNVPDAFRRVPGVSAIFDEDEGRFVTARGLPPSYNYVTFDGAGVATIGGFGDGSRNVNLEAIPSTAVKRLEVYKTYTPDQDLGWIGGYFNLVTRSAYDYDGFYAIGKFEANYYTFDEVPNFLQTGRDKEGNFGGRIEFAVSDTFGSRDQFGFVLSGTYNEKSRDERKVIQDNYRFLGDDNNGDGVGDIAVPERFRHYVYTNFQQRYGIDGKLEWRPTVNSHISWNSFVYVQQEDENRFGHQIRDIDAADITVEGTNRGSFTGAFGELTFSFFPLDRRYGGSVVESEFDFGERGTFSFDGGITFAEYADGPFPEIFIRTGEVLSGTYNTSDLIQRVQLDDPSKALFIDDSQYTNVVTNERRTRESWSTIWTFKGDYDWNTDSDGFGFKVGGEYRELKSKRDNTRIRYVRGTDTGIQPGFTQPVNYSPPGRPNGVPFVMIDLFEFQKNANFEIDEAETFNRNNQDDFTYTEDILAGFAMGTYTGPNYKFIAGFRYEDVDTGGRFFSRQENGAQDIFIRQDVEGGYDFIKPSVSALWEPIDNLILKASFSQTVGRPNPDQVSRSGQGIQFGEDGNLQSLTRGNPDLEPRQSDNYDISAEYYFDEGEGLVSVAVFYKDITDEIVTLSQTETIAFQGQQVQAIVTQPVNAETAEVFGVEAQIIKNAFDFLPKPFDGFGFSGNFTYTDAETTLAPGRVVEFLQFQSKWLANAALFYNWNDVFEFRAAYSYIGKYNDTVTDNPASRRGWADFDTLDLSARYDVNDHIRVTFQARNVLDENRVRIRGPELDLLHEDVEFGKSYFLGVTLNY